MTAVVASPDHRWRQIAGDTGWTMLLAVPLALGTVAAASIVIAVVAVPVTLLQTHDRYVASLALSYGPYAAATALQIVAGATLIWGIAHSLVTGLAPERRALRLLLSAMAGGLAATLALWLAQSPLPVGAVALWSYGPMPAWLPVQAMLIVCFGALAGGLMPLLPAPVAVPRWRDALRHRAFWLICYSLVFAALLEFLLLILALTAQS